MGCSYSVSSGTRCFEAEEASLRWHKTMWGVRGAFGNLGRKEERGGVGKKREEERRWGEE